VFKVIPEDVLYQRYHIGVSPEDKKKKPTVATATTQKATTASTIRRKRRWALGKLVKTV